LSLDEAFQEHHPELVRLAGLLTGSREEANDIVAEVFARLVRAGRPFDVDHPLAYLRRAVVNEATSGRRKAARRRDISDRFEPPVVTTASEDGRVDEQERILAVLRGLPVRQRTAIVLRFYHDLTEAQTADAMGVAVGTVKSSVARGLASLRATLDAQEGSRR